jgi:hypothetical protein
MLGASVSAPLYETDHCYPARGVHARTSEQGNAGKLGVPELIADDFKDCTAIALRVAAGAMHGKEMKERLLASSGELFGRVEPLHAVARHLEEIHGSMR